MVEPFGRPLPDARQAPPVVAQEHRATEESTEAEAETETLGETSGPEGQEQATTEEGITDGGEEREMTKWEKVVDIVQLDF